MKYPDGEIVTTGYNNNMLPTDVSGADNYVPSMTYDSAGRLLTRALGNGLTQTYDYYPWNQQGGRLHTLVTGSLQNLSYQYDSVGNITQIANSIAGETSVYDYDALDRLTSWTLNQNSPETYTYDAQGNLDVKNGMNLNYNDASHKHAVTHIGAAQKYWYDDNGNQITRIVGADTFNLIYDAENRLVEVKKNDVTISQFTYDGDGARVKSVIGGETIRFVGGYYERKGSQITKYYMAGAARVAVRKYTIPQNMTVEYMLGDHLGSTSVTTDSNGAMVSEMRYKPWGELRYTWTDAPANTSPAYELTRYQYTGQYSYDVEFGLKYYGARFYDSAVGRFVQADTKIPSGGNGQEWDRYAYTFNNPTTYVDPSGHEPITFFVLAALITVGSFLLSGCAPSPQEQIQAAIDKANATGDPNDYQAAINLAIDKFGISTDHMKGDAATYDEDQETAGHTEKSGITTIGKDAFINAEELIGTIYHESVHADLYAEGRGYTGLRGTVFNELEAYGKEYVFAKEHGFSADYLRALSDRLDELAAYTYEDGTPVLNPWEQFFEPGGEWWCSGPDCEPVTPSGQ